MDIRKSNESLEIWVEKQLSIGKYGFSLESLRKSFPNHSDTARKSALKRLADKGKILSIYKGYYLMLPPQYSGLGILPPVLFLDAFMKFLERPYYVGLLNAAALHGAGHQQPQEFFVVTSYPVLRKTIRKGLKLNYISVNTIPDKLLEQRKTESGYLNVSNPVLTAADLIHFEKRIGGLSRAATILNELADSIKRDDINIELIKHAPVTALQRLGYILEFPCNRRELADALHTIMMEHSLGFYRIPLKTTTAVKGYHANNRWQIIVNAEIDMSE